MNAAVNRYCTANLCTTIVKAYLAFIRLRIGVRRAEGESHLDAWHRSPSGSSRILNISPGSPMSQPTPSFSTQLPVAAAATEKPTA